MNDITVWELALVFKFGFVISENFVMHLIAMDSVTHIVIALELKSWTWQ